MPNNMYFESDQQFLDTIALKREKWYKRNSYYHRFLLNRYQNIVQKNSKILELGCLTGDLIGNLSPSVGVGVETSQLMVKKAGENFPGLNFQFANIETFTTEETFDYIIISGAIGRIQNIQLFLSNLKSMCTPDTRLIIDYFNPLWSSVIKFGQRFNLKMPEIVRNWLSMDDIQNFIYVSGYQQINRNFLVLFPKYIPVFSEIFNNFLGKAPIIRRFSLTHMLVSRPILSFNDKESKKCTVVITCRDEEGNIEGLVRRIPKMGAHTEIIFVEGHSKDNTVGKIQEMIEKYPEKDIKLLSQKGIGQGDAFRMGFDAAIGDFVIWLEADLTTPPEEAALFWENYISGKGEYINGSRFVYKMANKAMPIFNFLGNRFFGILFTLLLKQRFTDTLCGFKGISKENYLKIRSQIDYFGDFDPFGDFELIFGAIKNCLKVAEIPVHYQPRQYGESKAYGQSFFSFLKHAWLLIRMSWKAFIKFVIMN